MYMTTNKLLCITFDLVFNIINTETYLHTYTLHACILKVRFIIYLEINFEHL